MQGHKEEELESWGKHLDKGSYLKFNRELILLLSAVKVLQFNLIPRISREDEENLSFLIAAHINLTDEHMFESQ